MTRLISLLGILIALLGVAAAVQAVQFPMAGFKHGKGGDDDPPSQPLPHPVPNPPPKHPRPPRPVPPPPNDPSHPYPLPSWPAPSYLKTNLTVEHPAYFSTRELDVQVDERFNYGAWELLEREFRVPNTSLSIAKKEKKPHTRDMIAGVLSFPHDGGSREPGKADHPAAMLAYFQHAEDHRRPSHRFRGDMGIYDGGVVVLYDSVVEFIDTDGSGHFEPGSNDTILQAIDLPQLKFGDVVARRGNHSTIVEFDSDSIPDEFEPDVDLRALVGDEVGIEDSEGILLGPRSVHLDFRVADFPFTRNATSLLAIRILIAATSPHANLSLTISGNKISCSSVIPHPFEGYLNLTTVASTSEPNQNGTKGSFSDVLFSSLRSVDPTSLPPSPAAGFLQSSAGKPTLVELYVTFATTHHPTFIKWGVTVGLGREVVLLGPDAPGGGGGKDGLKHRNRGWWKYVLAVIVCPMIGALIAGIITRQRGGYEAVGGFD